MTGFRDLQDHVEANVFLSGDWFGEAVTLRDDEGNEVRCQAHCKYSVREENGVVIETLAASFLKDAWPGGPEHGCRLYRADDERAFVWRFNGSETRNRYRGVFERRTQKRAGTKER
jgi:hypothetical protein